MNFFRRPKAQLDEQNQQINVISAVVQSNGSMTVKGRVNNAPAEFDYQTLRPDFLGDGALTGPSTVQAQGSGLFTLFVVATPTDAYAPKADAGKPVELRITTAGDFQTQAGSQYTSKNCIPRPMWPPPVGTDVAKDCHKFTLQTTFDSRVHQGIDAMQLIIGPQIWRNSTKIFSDASKDEKYLNGLTFYTKNLSYDRTFGSNTSKSGGAFSSTSSRNGRITVGNRAFSSASQLAKSMMHEYFLRRYFMNGKMFSQKVGEIEELAYKRSITLNENKSLSFRVNNKLISLGSSELTQDKDSLSDILIGNSECPKNPNPNNPSLKLICDYVLTQPEKSPEYRFDRKDYIE